ncbi:hypothetical protein CYMTET_3839 [Cymbomonas tetramitiformis]|uniref:Uncharacterized protein n=1 Tax=Cymbomonas tetramitiformis TaxID=36881 RepID=A0AAE0LKN1_9CHLO|nr:hypothetical protein CYMTET_3839 [Cymbomonas tetramitiformis]
MIESRKRKGETKPLAKKEPKISKEVSVIEEDSDAPTGRDEARDMSVFDSDADEPGEEERRPSAPSNGAARLGKAARKKARKAAKQQERLKERELASASGQPSSNTSATSRRQLAKHSSEEGPEVADMVENDAVNEREEMETELHSGALDGVKGVMLGEDLVLVDPKTKRVYSSTQRGPADEHICIGTWDEEGKTLIPLPRKPKPATEALAGGGSLQDLEPIKHPFEVDVDDHCETSPEAHKDIVGVLGQIALGLGKAPEELVIYDPFYCAGGSKRNLGALGFGNVINRCEDFYAVEAAGEIPEHDVVVTNPPYSGEHMEHALKFCARNQVQHGRPWLMLLPSYVHQKPYYVPTVTREAEQPHDPVPEPFFIYPTKRYCYWIPKPLIKVVASARSRQHEDGAQFRKKRTHKGPLGERTSPFISMWFCGLGSQQRSIAQWFQKQKRGGYGAKPCMIALTAKQLPPLFQSGI